MEPAALARAEEPQVDRRGEPERQTMLVDLERGRAVRRPQARVRRVRRKPRKDREQAGEVLREIVVAEEPPLLHAIVPRDAQVLVAEVLRAPGVEARVVGPGADCQDDEDRRCERRVPAGERALVDLLPRSVDALGPRRPWRDLPPALTRKASSAKSTASMLVTGRVAKEHPSSRPASSGRSASSAVRRYPPTRTTPTTCAANQTVPSTAVKK